MVSLVLMRYQGRDWHGHLRVEQELPEFFAVCLTCDSDCNLTVDVNVHVLKTASCLTLSLFSPYWLINKTSRVLQYRADELSLKHPADLRDIVLFSFRKKNLFSKSKVRLNPLPRCAGHGFRAEALGAGLPAGAPRLWPDGDHVLNAAAPAEGLHQLLVGRLLSGHSGKLRLRPLSRQQHGLPGKTLSCLEIIYRFV